MATTLNLSLSPDQLAWVKARKEEAGFASTSDVIRDLIRREREKELDRLEAADGEAPVKEIVRVVRQVKNDLRKKREPA